MGYYINYSLPDDHKTWPKELGKIPNTPLDYSSKNTTGTALSNYYPTPPPHIDGEVNYLSSS